MEEKLAKLSPALRGKIIVGTRSFIPNPNTPVTNFLVHNKRHCNGGRTIDAGLWLKEHLDKGGKLFLTMSGAGSSFELGIPISKLIRAGKIHGISVSGANMEESMYRYVAHSYYYYIPDYMELTPSEENELREAGLRRITDTFLPEDESVRKILPKLEYLWRKAETENKSYLWHKFFFQLFEQNLIKKDPQADENDCWLYQAWKHNIPVYVPGAEDSTMGNIFTHACYDGKDRLLSKYKLDCPINPSIIKPGFAYMHHLAEWYIKNTQDSSIAFLQLGGGIAADFPICVVPHLKHDYMADENMEVKDATIRPWAGFIEIHSSPMSFGSYSGAGWKEKITWDKFSPEAFGSQIFGDYTEHFPDIAAIILGE
ncbi:MAG: deoxyhypusine synthase family protein [Candidatus Absconditabacterales bacterium]|jgi:deoxyhypusine synthase